MRLWQGLSLGSSALFFQSIVSGHSQLHSLLGWGCNANVSVTSNNVITDLKWYIVSKLWIRISNSRKISTQYQWKIEDQEIQFACLGMSFLSTIQNSTDCYMSEKCKPSKINIACIQNMSVQNYSLEYFAETRGQRIDRFSIRIIKM